MYFASESNSATAVISFLVAGEDKQVIGSINTADGSSYEIEGEVLVKVNKMLIQDGEKGGLIKILIHLKHTRMIPPILDDVEPPKQGKLSEEEARQLSNEHKLLIKGIEDQETKVDVSVMIYYTKEFAATEPNIDGYLKNMFMSANMAMENSNIPVRLAHHCTELANIGEGNSLNMLYQLVLYKGLCISAISKVHRIRSHYISFLNRICYSKQTNS